VFQDIFKTQAASFRTIYLVIDGFDETASKERKDILSLIRPLLELQNVLLLIFSRPTKDNQQDMNDFKLNIETASVCEDIRLYLAWRFADDERLRSIGGPLREEIEKILLD